MISKIKTYTKHAIVGLTLAGIISSCAITGAEKNKTNNAPQVVETTVQNESNNKLENKLTEGSDTVEIVETDINSESLPMTDNSITLDDQYIEFTNINDGLKLRQGDTHRFEWDSSDNITNFTLGITNEYNTGEWLAFSENNEGFFEWHVPIDLRRGSYDLDLSQGSIKDTIKIEIVPKYDINGCVKDVFSDASESMKLELGKGISNTLNFQINTTNLSNENIKNSDITAKLILDNNNDLSQTSGGNTLNPHEDRESNLRLLLPGLGEWDTLIPKIEVSLEAETDYGERVWAQKTYAIETFNGNFVFKPIQDDKCESNLPLTIVMDNEIDTIKPTYLGDIETVCFSASNRSEKDKSKVSISSDIYANDPISDIHFEATLEDITYSADRWIQHLADNRKAKRIFVKSPDAIQEVELTLKDRYSGHELTERLEINPDIFFSINTCDPENNEIYDCQHEGLNTKNDLTYYCEDGIVESALFKGDVERILVPYGGSMDGSNPDTEDFELYKATIKDHYNYFDKYMNQPFGNTFGEGEFIKLDLDGDDQTELVYKTTNGPKVRYAGEGDTNLFGGPYDTNNFNIQLYPTYDSDNTPILDVEHIDSNQSWGFTADGDLLYTTTVDDEEQLGLCCQKDSTGTVSRQAGLKTNAECIEYVNSQEYPKETIFTVNIGSQGCKKGFDNSE